MNATVQKVNINDFLKAIASLSQLFAEQNVSQTVTERNQEPILTEPDKEQQSIDSLYSDYIKRLIKETAGWMKYKKESEIGFADVKAYRDTGQWITMSDGLRMREVKYRIERLCYLKGVEMAYAEFDNDVCNKIGISKHDLVLEPYIISRYFNAGYKYRQFNLYDIIGMNKEHTEKAREVIFALEAKYGVYDTDRKYFLNHKKLFENKNINTDTMSNKEYITVLESIAAECSRICRVQHDEAVKFVFEYVERKCKNHFAYKGLFENYSFSGNYMLDMIDIMSNIQLRKTFLNIANCITMFVWR